MTTNPDRFDGFDAPDEIAAFVFHEASLEALQELLSHLIETKVIDRQTLMEIADKLEAAGLSEGAALARAAIERDPVPGNRKSRLAAAYRAGRIGLDDLTEAGIDGEVIRYCYQSLRKPARQ